MLSSEIVVHILLCTCEDPLSFNFVAHSFLLGCMRSSTTEADDTGTNIDLEERQTSVESEFKNAYCELG
jgi:hypothetical protein